MFLCCWAASPAYVPRLVHGIHGYRGQAAVRREKKRQAAVRREKKRQAAVREGLSELVAIVKRQHIYLRRL